MTLRRIGLFTAILLLSTSGIAVFLLSSSTQKEWHIPKDSAIQIKIQKPKEILLFAELLTPQNQLNPHWYEFLNPIQFMFANGMIKSILGYLLLDVSRPLEIAVQWKEDTPYLLLILPSSFGIEGAENLSRHLGRLSNVEKISIHTDTEIWKSSILVPHLSPTTLFWTGKPKHILLAACIDNCPTPYDFSTFYEEAPSLSSDISLVWNRSAIPVNFSIPNTPIMDLSININQTSTKLKIEGKGYWTAHDIPQKNIPKTLLAGWNIDIVPAFAIHQSTENTVCATNNYQRLRKQLHITEVCSAPETTEYFMFASRDIFATQNIPIRQLDLSIWAHNSVLEVNGILEKETPNNALFPLYIWIYHLFSNSNSK